MQFVGKTIRCVGAAALTILGLSVAHVAAYSHESSAPAEVVADQSPVWRAIDNQLLTPDGKWLIYVLAPSERARGESIVIRRSTQGATESRYAAGKAASGGGANLELSESGKWLAFLVAREQRMDVTLVDVESGAHTTYEGIQQFDFAGEKLLLQHGPELIAQTLGKEERTRLSTSATVFSVSPTQSHVAWVDAQGLHAYDAASGATRKLDFAAGSDYSSLTWSGRGRALAAIRSKDTKQELIAFRNVGSRSATVLDVQQWKDLPQGYSVAAPLQWRDDERGLFFGIVAPPRPAPASAVPRLRVWHWKDEKLPGDRRISAPRRDWCFVDLQNRKFVRLSDETLETVEPHTRARYVVGYDLNPYGWFNKGPMREASALRQLRDYYRVDVRTGRRDLIVAGLKVWPRPGISLPPTVSPDGSTLLYQDGSGDLIATDLATLERRNLTKSLPTKFYFPENDPRNDMLMKDSYGQGDPRVQGWTADGRYVLVSDCYDVWALPLRAGRALNLTGNGHQQQTWYRLVFQNAATYAAATSVDLNEPLYFQSFELDTARQGLVRRTPGKEGLEQLYSDYASLVFTRSSDATTYLVQRETAVAREHFRLDAAWKLASPLTDINPQQRGMAKSPGARFLTYSSPGGKRHAALHLPVGYVEGQAYPTIVMIYKGLSGNVHTYHKPNDQLTELLERGYAVLLPDILPRVDEPGAAAVEDVTAGVEAAVRTGVVDRHRLGLVGHSFGGYETNFIITQTDLFKAAVGYAGMSDLLSVRGSVYGDAWPWAQTDQPYLSGHWWEAWDAYVKNSPLFHARNISTPLLLVHGDRDSAVPFEQALELFNALRIMGDKPVVLLEYKGENHEFSDPALYRDYRLRCAEFFDHFLKGAPAPAWWAEGVSLYEGQVPAP